MKYSYLFLCMLFLSFASVAQTTYPSGVTGCIARWDFTNSTGTFTSLPDVSGNSNNGSTTNLSATTGWRGGINTAGNFSGSNSYATVASNSMLSPSAVTIVAAVQPTSYYNGQCQFNTILIKGSDYNVSGSYGMSIFDNDMNCGTLGSSQTVDFIRSATNPPFIGPAMSLNSWYFLATSFDGTQIKRYCIPLDASNYQTNITPSSVTPLISSLGSNSTDIRIGENQNTTSLYAYPFTGSMDEVALFNKELSDAEIQSIYNYLWGGVVINQPFTDTFICPGAPFNLNFAVLNTNAFNGGNAFTAELSDAFGNFTTPIPIGSLAGTASGSIPCTMPPSASGSGYRIRITATNPTYVSPDNGKNIVIGHGPITASISANPGNTVPNNTSVTFTAAAPVKGTSITYTWKKNNNAIPGAASSASYTGTSSTDFKDGDSISVKIVVSDTYCAYTDSSESNKIGMSVGVGIKNVNSVNNLKVFPNPNAGIFTITGQTMSNATLHAEVLNSVGQVVYQTEWQPLNNRVDNSIKLEHAPAGVYVLRIKSGDGITTTRFTISK